MASRTPSGSQPLIKRDTKRRQGGAQRRPGEPRGSSNAYLGAAAFVLAAAAVVVALIVVNNKPPETGPAAVVTNDPPPPPPPPPPTAQPETPVETPQPEVATLSPLKLADHAIAQARDLRASKDLVGARRVLEGALAQSAIAAHPIASDLLRKELALVAKAEEAAKPSERPDESTPSEEPSRPDRPERPDRPRPDTPTFETPDAALTAVRAREAALDLAGARELIDQLDAAVAKRERAELDARAAYLDALGAAVPQGTLIALEQQAKRHKIARASSKGLALDDPRSAEVPFTKFPKGALVELVNQTEKQGIAGPPLGAALVLYDLGLWGKGDQRLKQWLDAAPAEKARAFAILARARGLTSAPIEGYVWKSNEWLSPDEAQGRSQDSVYIDGRSVNRDDARKLVEKERRSRKPSKKAQEDVLRAKAAKLKSEFGVTDIKTILSSGDPAKRCDVVIVSDGFAAADVSKFEKVAQTIAQRFLTIEPWRNYSHYVNVHRITVVEPKSGLGDSRLGSRVSAGILEGDEAKAAPYATLAPDCDLLVVVANIANVRASAVWGMITLDLSADFGEVVLHELGHAFGHLNDEYVDAQVAPSHPDFGPDRERYYPNVTRESNPKHAKWHYWMLPPATPESALVGCFAGAYYRNNYFRPARQCRMSSRSYNHFCPICLEKMEKSLYERLEPADDATPRQPVLVAWRDDPSMKFEVTALAIESAGEKLGGFESLWWVDGRAVKPHNAGIKTSYDLSLSSLAPGEHQVACRVELNDVRVRRDDGVLASTRAWRVKLLDAPRPKIVAPDTLSARRGEVLACDVTLEGGLEGSILDAKGPPGSQLVVSEKTARFVWAPPRDARGAWRVAFGTGDGPARIEKTVTIVLQDDERDVGPVLRDPGVVPAVRGQPLELALEAFDADGDALVWSSKKLPPGAEVDAAAGVLRWTPSFSIPFETDLEVPIHVTDGKYQDDLAIKLHVENRSIAGAGAGFDLLVALRSVDPEVRKAALAALPTSDLAPDGKVLELSRLLRDFEPDVASAAARALRDLTMADGVTSAHEARRNMLVLDDSTKLWQLTDRPDALALLKDLVAKPLEGELKGVGVKMQKDLKAIEKYNDDRR